MRQAGIEVDGGRPTVATTGPLASFPTAVERGTRGYLEPATDDVEPARELERARRAFEVLRFATASLASASRAKEAMDVVAAAVGELLEADRVAVVVRSGTHHVLVSKWGPVPCPVGLNRPDVLTLLSDGLATSCARTVRDGSRELGTIWVGRDADRSFTAYDLEILQTLADLTALSLEHYSRAMHDAPSNATEPTHDDDHEPRAAAATGEARERLDPTALDVPTFPPALLRIVGLTECDDTTPAALHDAVTLAPALAAKALSVASAPALGRAKPARSLKEALMVLGLRGVRNLAIAQFARSLFTRWNALDELLWEHALGTAAGMQVVLERNEPAVAEDGYLCGLLHNVGKIALHNVYPARYERVVAMAAAGECSWHAAELDLFGTTATQCLPALIGEWALPPRVARTLRELARDVVDGSTANAFAWAAPTALQSNTKWRTVLGDRPQPGWLVEQAERGRQGLGLDDAAARRAEATIVQRCQALRQLVG